MADGEEKGGWWGSWVKSAKDKSLYAINVVKRDLAEFSSVMQEDTVKAASKVKEKLTQENANAATEKVKQGVTNLLGGISKALVVEPDDNYQPAQIVGGEAIVFDRYKARLHAIQVDPATYTTEPSGEGYQDWMSNMNLDNMKGDISEILVSNVEVRALYTQLVPGKVSNIDFWRRYYYRRHLLEEEEARRLELMKRAEDSKEQKDLGWDEDDDDWTEARAHSAGSDSCSARLAPVPDTSSVEITGKPEQGWTSVELSSETVCANSTEEAKELKVTQMPEVEVKESAVTEPEPPETNREVLIKTNTDPELETISRAQTSSSNFSEIAVPVSDSSLEMLAVVTAGDVQSLESTHSSDPSLSEWSGLSDVKTSEDDSTKVLTLEKIDVTDSSNGRKTPSDDSSNTKESLDEEWEKDFDVEVTEEDLQAAQNYLKRANLKKPEGADEGPEDWEDW